MTEEGSTRRGSGAQHSSAGEISRPAVALAAVPARRLALSESLLLDGVRVSAAVVVAVGHVTQPYFSRGVPDLTPLALRAVAVFFILSGFVIRYVTCRRPGTLGNYLIDRASRLYSVVLPAIALTLLADAVSFHVNPSFYLAHWQAPWTTASWAGVGENLLFQAQDWGLNGSVLSNSPFWSLSYEAIYYVLYGCLFYLRGYRRWLATLAVALLAGPKVMLLWPVWLLGWAAHDLYQRWTARGTAARILNRACVALVAALGLAALVLWQSRAAREAVLALHRRTEFAAMDPLVGHSAGVLLFTITGLAAAIVFLRLLAAARRFDLSGRTRSAAAIRFLSEGTFPIYLFHFPLYVLLASCVAYDHRSPWPRLGMLLGVCIVGVLAGHPCNLLKLQLRALLFRCFPGAEGADRTAAQPGKA